MTKTKNKLHIPESTQFLLAILQSFILRSSPFNNHPEERFCAPILQEGNWHFFQKMFECSHFGKPTWLFITHRLSSNKKIFAENDNLQRKINKIFPSSFSMKNSRKISVQYVNFITWFLGQKSEFLRNSNNFSGLTLQSQHIAERSDFLFALRFVSNYSLILSGWAILYELHFVLLSTMEYNSECMPRLLGIFVVPRE